MQDKTLRLAYISSKGDTAFTLFYIKRHERNSTAHSSPTLSPGVRSCQSGIFNSPCTGIRPIVGRICISPWIPVSHRKQVRVDMGASWESVGIHNYTRQSLSLSNLRSWQLQKFCIFKCYNNATAFFLNIRHLKVLTQIVRQR